MERRGQDGLSWYDLSLMANNIPCEPELAIIVTSWRGHLKFLKASLESHRKSGAFVILSYDNPFYPWQPENSYEIQRSLPNINHYVLANAFVMKHITADADKRNGWFWNVRYAQGILKSFPNIKYVYCTNGDCVCEKPEGFKGAIGLLGEAGLMSGQSTEGVIHTAAWISKIEAFNRIIDFMYERMKIPVIGSRSPERMLKEAIDTLKLDYKHVPRQPLDKDGTVDMYCRYNQDSTWKELLGFRNIFAEYETLGNEGMELWHLKPFMDDYYGWLYWRGEEQDSICKYWETGDRRYLYMFWDRWADSNYNRLFYPVEQYGKEPIYEPEACEKIT